MGGAAQRDRSGRHAGGGSTGLAIAGGVGQFAMIQAVAPSVGVDVSAVNLRDAAEIERPSPLSHATPTEVSFLPRVL